MPGRPPVSPRRRSSSSRRWRRRWASRSPSTAEGVSISPRRRVTGRPRRGAALGRYWSGIAACSRISARRSVRHRTACRRLLVEAGARLVPAIRCALPADICPSCGRSCHFARVVRQIFSWQQAAQWGRAGPHEVHLRSRDWSAPGAFRQVGLHGGVGLDRATGGMLLARALLALTKAG